MPDVNEKKNVKNLKTKTVLLKAFSISAMNEKLSESLSDLSELLYRKLEETRVKNRIMRLSESDDEKTSDSISYYDRRENITLGTVLRTSGDDKVGHVPNQLMENKKFSISDIKNSKIDKEIQRTGVVVYEK